MVIPLGCHRGKGEIMKMLRVQFEAKDFSILTPGGPQVVPAIHCGNGIYVHRPGDNDRNPSPIWVVSAKCGYMIKECFVPHMAFNDFLLAIEETLSSLDWTGNFDEIMADENHKEAASFFLGIVTPIEGKDY